MARAGADVGGGVLLFSQFGRYAEYRIRAKPPQSKTLYLGETSALCSAANCAAVTAGAALQPALEALLGARSMSVLFLLSGILVSMNVWISGSRLPAEKRS